MTRLAEDRRARVPFALVGVLLLVGASTFGAAISTRGPSRVDHDADVAMDRASAGATTALRSAVGEAARAAAAEPVTTPAETPYGRLLNDTRPFRDALRLRLYLTLTERLSVTRYRRGDVTAVASLPDATTPAELRRGMDRIDIEGVDNGTALRVTVRNLTVTARESGRVVAREQRAQTVTVDTPVLALHDRAVAFERRLNRGPLEGPGLGRRLTARLYPLAWARGYAQYSGLPITNVVANRHVETSTNGALLTTQRAVFGRSDPVGRRSTRRAMFELGVRDLTVASGGSSAWIDRVLPRPNQRETDSASLPLRRGTSAPSPDHPIDVDVEPLSGRSLAGLRSDAVRSNCSLAGLFRAAYRVETRLKTTRQRTYHEPRPDPEPPSEEWTHTDTRVSVHAEVEPSGGPTPGVAGEERRFRDFTRHVTLNRRVEWVWEKDNETRTTEGEWTERYRVGVSLVGEYAPNATAPDRPTTPKFERGGPLDGPNLADVPAKAATRLVEQQGGRDAVAVAVANDSLAVTERVVYGDQSTALRSWTNDDLSSLRGRLRNVSVSVRAGRIATYTANPPKRLAAELRRRRTALVDPPEQYRGAADRARVAARAALVNATIHRLERRATSHDETRRAFDTVLGRAGVDSPETLHRILRQQRSPTPSGGAAAPVHITPEGSPAYLTVASVSHDRASAVPPSRAYHPLSAKNVNLFAAPYGDAADTVAAPGFDMPDRVRLRTAARVSIAAKPLDNGTIRESHRDLRASVASSVERLRHRARRALEAETRLTPAEARRAVSAGFGRWESPERRALAASNGSAAEAIATAAAAQASTPDDGRTARLTTHLDAAFAEALRSRSSTVAERRVNDTVSRVRERAISAATNRATAAAKRRVGSARLNETLGAVPAGLPVAPVPGYWYATVNVWTVSVRGAYARFALRTRRGAPAPGGAVRYIRDGSTVRLDVDGDGDAERLGRDERVSFRTRTVIAVAVPPNRGGVGDVDGNADERAGTWPHPNCTSWVATDCPDSE